MKNYVQEGQAITVLNPDTVPYGAGDLLIVNNLAGVCANDVASGGEVEIVPQGVFEFPKLAGEINQGADVYWSKADKAIANAGGAAGLWGIGVATEHAATDAATVKVLIVGMGVFEENS
jgi:predicted RecA/RadA family phage recombinase